MADVSRGAATPCHPAAVEASLGSGGQVRTSGIRARSRTLRALAACWISLSVCGCAPQPPAAPAAEAPEAEAAAVQANEVVVLGMIHGRHRESQSYGIDVIQGLIRAIDPDLVLVEIPPDRLPAAIQEFEERGVIEEPRVLRFPEYVDALFPLTREMDFEVVATAGWTRSMADSRRAKLEEIENDPSRAADWAAYEAANQRSDEAVAAGGAPDDPRWIHTNGYDEAVEIGLSVYNTLFNAELGEGGWDNINAAHYGHIAAALDAHRGTGKRFLITYGSGHKGWFLRQLRQRDDIELLDVAPFLDAIAR